MMSSITRHNDYNEGYSALKQLIESRATFLGLFFGTETPSGESWCPDCVLACPPARGACRRLLPEVPLHEFAVGDRNEWKRPSKPHPFREDKTIGIERIPTLIRWVDGKMVGKLVEGECLDKDKLEKLLSKH